ncbi:DUF2470 domain-containing protein [Microbacterium sp.]|uniref:DUF2470 domain-containing protein n=1 Tax=Microbacterium sp. TaxID=51671 RepID=UPI003A89323C
MTDVFDDDVVRAILQHMNDDHRDDNVLIVRAFSPHSDIVASEMIGLDASAGRWRAVASDGASEIIEVPWPGGPSWSGARCAARSWRSTTPRAHGWASHRDRTSDGEPSV